MPLILQGKYFLHFFISFQGLRYSCILTPVYPDVFFLLLRFCVSRSKLGRSTLTNQGTCTKTGIHNWGAKATSFRGSTLFIPFHFSTRGFSRRGVCAGGRIRLASDLFCFFGERAKNLWSRTGRKSRESFKRACQGGSTTFGLHQ